MISESRKAIVAAFVAFLGPIGVVLAATDQPLDWRVFAASVVSGLVTGGGVWLVRNGAAPADPVVDDEPGKHAE